MSEPEELVEALNGGGGRTRKCRQKRGGQSSTTEEVYVAKQIPEAHEANRIIDDGRTVDQVTKIGLKPSCTTPASGINLISGSENSKVSDSVCDDHGSERDKLLEAAKLLSIQKEVGFSFEEDEKEKNQRDGSNSKD
ncbi:hypothetical protein A2U01_0040650 [Trifolium medium]|uniref:Uncharacterized protein n=1 Tax=Trifolium medium TaxID=97028 RepID=A0A392Q5T4_9FABA|nr:hypothetical protein [Trifolium medium]